MVLGLGDVAGSLCLLDLMLLVLVLGDVAASLCLLDLMVLVLGEWLAHCIFWSCWI